MLPRDLPFPTQSMLYETHTVEELRLRLLTAYDSVDVMLALVHHRGERNNWREALCAIGLRPEQWDAAMEREGWGRLAVYVAEARGLPRFSSTAQGIRDLAVIAHERTLARAAKIQNRLTKADWNFPEPPERLIRKLDAVAGGVEAKKIETSSAVSAVLDALRASQVNPLYQPALEADAERFVSRQLEPEELLMSANELIARSERSREATAGPPSQKSPDADA